jgi:hypothetical protein
VGRRLSHEPGFFNLSFPTTTCLAGKRLETFSAVAVEKAQRSGMFLGQPGHSEPADVSRT